MLSYNKHWWNCMAGDDPLILCINFDLTCNYLPNCASRNIPNPDENCTTNVRMKVEYFAQSATYFQIDLEMFYLNSTLNFGIPPVLVFQLEVYYKVDRLLTGLTAQQKGTTARWYSN